jgi:D-threo-aldose 1-dehydrogenase
LSETIIGLAFKERPQLAQNCIVTTKCGRRYAGYDFSYDAVVRDVYESLERLGLEQLDIVYIHDPMDYPMDEVMGKECALGALRHLQDEGAVRYIGTAANDPQTNIEYIATGEFDAAVIADSWSLLNQLALRELFPMAEKHGVGLVAATPIERGLLATGPIAGMNYLSRNFSQACLDHVSKIQALCEKHDIPMLAVALQWCTRHPLVASTIPGARIPEEARASMQAAQIEISDSFWGELEPLVKHFEVGVDR